MSHSSASALRFISSFVEAATVRPFLDDLRRLHVMRLAMAVSKIPRPQHDDLEHADAA